MSTASHQISELRRDFERLRSDNRRLRDDNRTLKARLTDVKKDVRSLESHMGFEVASVRDSVKCVQYSLFDLEDDFEDVHGRVGRRFRNRSVSPDRSRSPSPSYRRYAYTPSADGVSADSSLEDTPDKTPPKEHLRNRFIDDEAPSA